MIFYSYTFGGFLTSVVLDIKNEKNPLQQLKDYLRLLNFSAVWQFSI